MPRNRSEALPKTCAMAGICILHVLYQVLPALSVFCASNDIGYGGVNVDDVSYAIEFRPAKKRHVVPGPIIVALCHRPHLQRCGDFILYVRAVLRKYLFFNNVEAIVYLSFAVVTFYCLLCGSHVLERFREHSSMQLSAFKETDPTGGIRSRLARRGTKCKSERSRVINDVRKHLYKETS
ncbi:hypothetical protein PsorP6_016635 [Peronosclerospora sorghi]|uniref:Uncharacterized protein n=1 Tax=Peronosclerospora sorghi TaxID=230839 RepID=A0ACC0VNZ5_9STRA|nr:hypothetical protein PsorP6_016635 [Peronosclerospora sorghi]